MEMPEILSPLLEKFDLIEDRQKPGEFNEISQQLAGNGELVEFDALAEFIIENGSPNSVDYITNMRNNMKSIVMVISAKHLTLLDSNLVRVDAELLKKRAVSYRFPICNEIAYGDQPSAKSIGTGFFIDDQIIATAAHVVFRPNVQIEDIRFVQGVYISTSDDFKNGIVVPSNRVFKIAPQQIPLSDKQFYFSEAGSDFAVFRVVPAYDHDGYNASAIFSAMSKVSMPADIMEYNNRFKSAQGWNNVRVYSFGHGLNLPVKLSDSGKIVHAPKTFPYFETDLLLLGGSSGSPVFCAETHKLLGIYVRGTKKLEITSNGKCKNPKIDCNGDCMVLKPQVRPAVPAGQSVDGQECQRLEFVWEALKHV